MIGSENLCCCTVSSIEIFSLTWPLRESMKIRTVLKTDMQAAIIGLFLGITAKTDQAAKHAFKEVAAITNSLSDEELDVCKAIASLYAKELKFRFFAVGPHPEKGVDSLQIFTDADERDEYVKTHVKAHIPPEADIFSRYVARISEIVI
jgi:hypothetical protein